MSAFWAVIPARRASTRLPDKALADIGGQPMVVRVAQRARLSGARRVVVATDCAEIQSVCTTQGIEAVITRADHPSGTDRIAELAATLAAPADQVIVNVQGDEPLIAPTLIAQVAQAVPLPEHHGIATAATPITTTDELRNPNAVKVVCNAHHEALYFSRAPIPWHRDAWPSLADVSIASIAGRAPMLRHIGIYAYRVRALQQFVSAAPSPLEQIEQLEQLRWFALNHAVQVVVTEDAPHAGVDTHDDLLRVRALWENQK